MFNSETIKEVTRKLNEALEKFVKDYGALIIKIDISQIRRNTAILKIDVATRDGTVIIPFDERYVAAGDTINLVFGEEDEIDEEKIPVKFHVEGNKLIFDEQITLLAEDELITEHHIDEEGNFYYTGVYIKRGSEFKEEG